MSNGRIGPPWWLMGRGTGGSRTVSGPVAHWEDKVVAPLRSLVANIEPVQDLHGYDNPWPAGGGKNKFNYENVPYGGSAVVNNGDGTLTIVVGGGSTGVATVGQKTLAQLVPNLVVGETYYLNATTTGTGKYIYASTRWNFGSALVMTQTILDSVVYFYASGLNSSATISDIIICKDSETDKSFAPYSNICPISGWASVDVMHSGADTSDPTVYTIQLGQTVYGGTLDVVSGVLTVDRAIRTITAFSGAWGATSNGFAVFDVVSGGIRISAANVVSNMFTKSGNGYSAMPTWSFPGGSGANTTITFVLGNGIASKAEADAFAASNPIQYTYCLATPTTIQLTPTEISTLQGQNNVWADTGDVTVTYLSGEGNPALVALALAHRIEE